MPALASSSSVGASNFLGPFGSRSLQRVAAAGTSQSPASWIPHARGVAPSVVEAAPASRWVFGQEGERRKSQAEPTGTPWNGRDMPSRVALLTLVTQRFEASPTPPAQGDSQPSCGWRSV
eukprot:14603806-Alexandrium_andersonii.AAC.1